MANPEQLELLKAGVEGWNNWRKETRKEQPAVIIDLISANLFKANLAGVDLYEANLTQADLSGTNLSDADLIRANLTKAFLCGADLAYIRLCKANLSRSDLSETDLYKANLKGSNLSEARLDRSSINKADFTEVHLNGANLSGSDLSETIFREADLTKANLSFAKLHKAILCGTNLSKANLRGANLSESNLGGANLREANFSGADLSGANLSGANLSETNFVEAIIGHTIFGNTDLSQTDGLETISHRNPSTIGVDTLQLSKGKIPEAFLRGCGLSDADIEYSKLANPDLTNEEIVKIQYRIYDLRATQALQISPLFISYSHADTDFVNQIDSAFTNKGVRFWRDIHNAKAGRLETQIDLAIRQNPTILLILSKNSLNSDWVQHEVRKARELEKELGRDALCPIALDDSWKSSKWPSRIMEQVTEYNILDFSGWKESSNFESKFAKLLNGLDLFYKKPKT